MNGSPIPVSQVRSALSGARESLWATLMSPPESRGMVLFAHGSGSSRFSERNRAVAEHLVRSGFTTLLADLLTETEEAIDSVTSEFRFDIPLLAERLTAATAHMRALPSTRSLPIGYFGASTGAGAALIAAADPRNDVAAVVSRGGRVDLAGESLPFVTAPTLLIVGSEDHAVIELNRRARAAMRAPCEIVLVPGATHLFEEPGALETVAELSAGWFSRYLGAVVRRSA